MFLPYGRLLQFFNFDTLLWRNPLSHWYFPTYLLVIQPTAVINLHKINHQENVIRLPWASWMESAEFRCLRVSFIEIDTYSRDHMDVMIFLHGSNVVITCSASDLRLANIFFIRKWSFTEETKYQMTIKARYSWK